MTIDPRTLRGQLALAYAVALLVALIVLAAGTLALVDRIQRSTLDDRLQLATRAVSAIVDQHDGTIALDPHDRTQFARIVGRGINAAVFGRKRGAIASTVVDLPDMVRSLAATGISGTQTVRTPEGALRVSAAALPVGKTPLGTVLVWGDFEGIEDLDRRLAFAFALAIPVVAAFAAIGGGFVAARGLRPLVHLAEIASEIEAHDLSRRIAVPVRDDELGRLCLTFDRMLDRLENAFDRERRFTSDASHELRAPLSVIRAEADLMLRRMRTPDEYERALRSIAQQADDLEELTRDLLAAARGEAVESAVSEPVDVGGAAAKAAERMRALARARNVAIAQSIEPGAMACGHEPAVRRAVTCVLHNALKYARADGRVEIAVHRGDTIVRVEVADDGPGFSEAALAHATERFWRDDAARPRGDDGGGSGLGLAIAAVIVATMHGTLRLANRATGGALVVVELPSFMRP
ncbi:hypothetical protein WPS_28180 [Vulcanimicrobium alpinum]|uniref:histidine kinase n=1 Tax=Vulcanimicrobium alpinum TaxID=3016050 RepID=A0AAN2CBA8_UNVUL|nr:HAMP domain-containing sensor histidine kinase [Vulcanimicrobium alpinum]BDE07542.1 hypothetical protein WPS_28180 [Vulcanimicrobium alpinum]